MICTILIEGKRRIGRIQPTHFKFVDYGDWSTTPNMEVDVKGYNSGRIARVVMSKVKLIFHVDLEEAQEECRRYNDRGHN